MNAVRRRHKRNTAEWWHGAYGIETDEDGKHGVDETNGLLVQVVQREP